jgi:ABC-type sugar transport system permease subunit
VFNIVEVMTQGGPNNSTQVLGSLLYQEAFWYDRMGLASAISTVIFAITLAITIFQLKTSRSETL